MAKRLTEEEKLAKINTLNLADACIESLKTIKHFANSRDWVNARQEMIYNLQYRIDELSADLDELVPKEDK